MSIQELKIETFDRYIMRGGTQTLQEIEEFSLATLELVDCKIPQELFDEVVTMVIAKMTQDNFRLGGLN
jgi:D-lyxose ketol-isomerase